MLRVIGWPTPLILRRSWPLWGLEPKATGLYFKHHFVERLERKGTSKARARREQGESKARARREGEQKLYLLYILTIYLVAMASNLVAMAPRPLYIQCLGTRSY